MSSVVRKAILKFLEQSLSRDEDEEKAVELQSQFLHRCKYTVHINMCVCVGVCVGRCVCGLMYEKYAKAANKENMIDERGYGT